MYVHGVTELEVKSPEEALEAFYRGQRQRSVSATILNSHSSRSHSIFNIRVVSVPLDPLGEDILSDSTMLKVSQLALVDLAGSERTNRTGNTGQRLQEAGKINQSLMTLRTCLEVLRDNQAAGRCNAVPYRDSRVTHLFRNYFEGEGIVKMIVCVNPRLSDYEENVFVMQFAEMTQEVMIERAVKPKMDIGLTPGRRRANQVYKEAMKRLEEEGQDVEDLVVDLSPVYTLGPDWPPLEIQQFDEEDLIRKLKSFLEQRIATRKTLLKDKENREAKFREFLRNLEKEVVLLRAENKQMKSQLDGERKKVLSLEQRLVSAETANRSLNNKINAYSDMKQVLENELDEKELALNAEKRERVQTKQKYKNKILIEREKIATECEKKISANERENQIKTSRQSAKINALKNLLNDDDSVESQEKENNVTVTVSDPNLRSRGVSTRNRTRRLSASPTRSVAVSNARSHRRSKSSDAQKWLDHRPAVGGPVPSNTVLQPVLRTRKSVTKIDRADLATPEKYMLTTSTQDQDGDVETRLYKGDVIPTVGGGRQVILNDVEVLSQVSPGKEAKGKRSYEEFRGIGGIADRIANLEKGGMTPNRGKRAKY